MSRRLRWLTIVVPALAVGAIELLSDSLLDVAFPVPLDTLLIVGFVLVLSADLLPADIRTDRRADRGAGRARTGRSSPET